MDFKTLNLCLEAKKISHNLYRTDFEIFVLVSFVFRLKFSSILIFRCINKTHLKSFVFKMLFIGDYSSTFYFFDDKVLSV